MEWRHLFALFLIDYEECSEREQKSCTSTGVDDMNIEKFFKETYVFA